MGNGGARVTCLIPSLDGRASALFLAGWVDHGWRAARGHFVLVHLLEC